MTVSTGEDFGDAVLPCQEWEHRTFVGCRFAAAHGLRVDVGADSPAR